jgi:hypothetical protein
MRSLMVVAIAAVLSGPAFAQGIPLGIPMGGDKPEKPVDPVKENEYRSAIGGMPAARPADPWGSVRETKPAAAPAKKSPPVADKNAAGAKKNPTTAKSTDAPKKAN